jgi:hypothetical protein
MTTPTTTKQAATVTVSCPACDGEGTLDSCEERANYGRQPHAFGCADCGGEGSVELTLSSDNDELGRFRGNHAVEAALLAAGFVAWSSDEAGTTYAVSETEAAVDAANGATVTRIPARVRRPSVRPGLAKTLGTAPTMPVLVAARLAV